MDQNIRIISNRCIISWYKGTNVAWVHGLLIRLLFRHADKVINQSIEMEHELKSMVTIDAPCVVLNNPFDIEKINRHSMNKKDKYAFINKHLHYICWPVC